MKIRRDCNLLSMACRQNAGHSEQNARAPQLSIQTVFFKIRCEGERDHVGRRSRHFAGKLLSTHQDLSNVLAPRKPS
jgi:hypothetical protein